jgi:hypothetical protein
MQFICGIITATYAGQAKSFSDDYSQYYPDLATQELVPTGLTGYNYPGPHTYIIFVGAIVTVVAFLRFLGHIRYLKSPIAPRMLAISDLVLLSVVLVFLLAGVIVLPVKVGDLFSNVGYDLPLRQYWLHKLKIAWIFMLLAFLMWLVSLVIAYLVVRNSGSQISDLDTLAPATKATTDVPMDGTPIPKDTAAYASSLPNISGQPKSVSDPPPPLVGYPQSISGPPQPVSGLPQAYKDERNMV